MTKKYTIKPLEWYREDGEYRASIPNAVYAIVENTDDQTYDVSWIPAHNESEYRPLQYGLKSLRAAKNVAKDVWQQHLSSLLKEVK